MKIAFRQCYIIGVWLFAIPAVLLCGLFGLGLSAMMPFFMAAPLLVALLLTLPVIDNRPLYRPVLLLGLFLAQVAAAYATVWLLAGIPSAWKRHTGLAVWFVAILLPFIIIALALIGARRDHRARPHPA